MTDGRRTVIPSEDVVTVVVPREEQLEKKVSQLGNVMVILEGIRVAPKAKPLLPPQNNTQEALISRGPTTFKNLCEEDESRIEDPRRGVEVAAMTANDPEGNGAAEMIVGKRNRSIALRRSLTYKPATNIESLRT